MESAALVGGNPLEMSHYRIVIVKTTTEKEREVLTQRRRKIGDIYGGRRSP